jgi:hypothetical protein
MADGGMGMEGVTTADPNRFARNMFATGRSST